MFDSGESGGCGGGGGGGGGDGEGGALFGDDTGRSLAACSSPASAECYLWSAAGHRRHPEEL